MRSSSRAVTSMRSSPPSRPKPGLKCRVIGWRCSGCAPHVRRSGREVCPPSGHARICPGAARRMCRPRHPRVSCAVRFLSSGTPKVLAVETFLADIAQNVAGDRLSIDSLIPVGVDPHSFEPTPADVRKVAGSDMLIMNGAGFEAFLNQLLQNAGGQRACGIDASKGLQSRQPKPGEHPAGRDGRGACGRRSPFLARPDEGDHLRAKHPGRPDRGIDPAGKDVYAANAEAYIAKLNELDGWIKQQVAQVPEARRLLVTNHESFGYFADRYGFRVVGRDRAERKYGRVALRAGPRSPQPTRSRQRARPRSSSRPARIRSWPTSWRARRGSRW